MDSILRALTRRGNFNHLYPIRAFRSGYYRQGTTGEHILALARVRDFY